MVRVNNTLSSITPIHSGVPQGSVLSPTLFNAYVNSIPRHPHTTLALFADDTALLGSAHHPTVLSKCLQAHIDDSSVMWVTNGKLTPTKWKIDLEKWFDKWKIAVNPNKCQAISFGRKADPPRIYVNDTVVSWSPTVKYLGVTLDKNLTWKPHIATIRGKLRGAEIAISPLLYSEHLSLGDKTHLYKTLIRPIASYASPVWAFHCKTNEKKLEAGQNKVLRRIRNGHRYLSNVTIRNDLGVTTLRKFTHKLASKFYNNFNLLGNEIIYELPDYNYTLPCKRPRAVLLYEEYPIFHRRGSLGKKNHV